MTRLFAGTPFDIPPTCDLCGQSEADCRCTDSQKLKAERQQQRDANRLPPDQQTARVQVESRKGKRRVTVISGLAEEANDLPALLTRLQSVCGSGGTIKSDPPQIELQGDHLNVIQKTLREIGFGVR